MTKISIELERDSGVYYAGEVVRGTVKLSCAAPTSCRSFNVQFKGRAKVHWHTGSGDNRNDYDGSTLYQDQRLTIRGNIFKTALLDECGEDAMFSVIHNSGIVQIPCTAQEAQSTSSSNFQLIVRAMDYDWGKKDDLLGEILLDVPKLVHSGASQSFPLTRNGQPEKGEITLSAKVLPYSALFPVTTRSGTSISQDIQKEYCLVLNVHQATGLRKADWFGKNDVYIQVYRPENAKRAIEPGKKLPGPEKKMTIEGEIVAPFAFPIRHDAPPSAELGVGDASYIRYNIRAYMDLANWKDPFCKRMVTVISNRPLPLPRLITPHSFEVGPNPLFSSCCGVGQYGMVTIKMIIDRLAYAPGERIDLKKCTVFYEGTKEVSAEVQLMGYYRLATPRTGTTLHRTYNLGSIPLTPNSTTTLDGTFHIPPVYPSFWGGVQNPTRTHYSCLQWTYTISIVVGGTGCGNFVQNAIPVLICSAPPYAKKLEEFRNVSPQQCDIGIWDVFEDAVVGPDQSCTMAPTLTGPEDGGISVNIGTPVNTWEGREDDISYNVGEGQENSSTYQPIVTTFEGPISTEPEIVLEAGTLLGEDKQSQSPQAVVNKLFRAMDEEMFDKRLAVGKWIRDHPRQAQELSPNDFNTILSKVTFSLDQPSVVGELLAAFEGSDNLTCQHVISTMGACPYQKTEVATMMAPFVSDPANKETVLKELDYSYDRGSVSEKFLE